MGTSPQEAFEQDFRLTGTLVTGGFKAENGPQGPAALYSNGSDDPLALERLQLITGVPPSYNNWCDFDRLLQTATHIAAAWDRNMGHIPGIALGVKHGNCCGASVGDDLALNLKQMVTGDPMAIFGGSVLVTFPLTEALAEVLLTWAQPGGKRRVLDTVIAPAVEPAALELLRRKGDKCRILVNPALATLTRQSLDRQPRFRYVRGGLLVQGNYEFFLDFSDPDLFQAGGITGNQHWNVMLAWAICATSNSNTITLVRNEFDHAPYLIGNGVGQQSRVEAVRLALKRAELAGHDPRDSVAASDSFFPFEDGPELLAEAGAKVIFTTSGSVRDEQVKALCAQRGVSLLMGPDSKYRGFFGH